MPDIQPAPVWHPDPASTLSHADVSPQTRFSTENLYTNTIFSNKVRNIWDENVLLAGGRWRSLEERPHLTHFVLPVQYTVYGHQVTVRVEIVSYLVYSTSHFKTHRIDTIDMVHTRRRWLSYCDSSL